MKMDELISRLGITIRYGPAYSPWSNGINKRNHASCDIMVRILIEDRKVTLTDSLVKAAAWTYNTNVNRLGYTPMQLVTGKSCNLLVLTLENEATESVSDTEAVQRVI